MRGIAVREGELRMVEDLDPPRPTAGQIEIEVVCASVNPTDLELAAGVYDAGLAAAGRLELPRTGLELSGRVVRGGQRFQPGDAVFGYVDLMEGDKAHQARVALGEGLVAAKPASLGFAEAAALPLGAQTSLVALRSVEGAGPRVLINGAAGGLGVYAVQIASRLLDLHVTAVAGPGQEGFLTGLGAHRVLDYTAVDIRDTEETFDVIFDLTTRWQFAEIADRLSPTGRFIPAEPLKAGVDFTPGVESGARSLNLWVPRGDGALLTEIARWVEDGKLQVFVDSVHRFDAYPSAFARMKESGRRGRVVLDLTEGA